MKTESPQWVHKHWSVIIAYYGVSSLAVGFMLATCFFLSLFSAKNHQRTPIHDELFFSLVAMGFISAVVFGMQAIYGPLIFTRNVICGKCQRPIKLKRIPFLGGKGRTTPTCACGGEYEPAFFWKLK